LRLRKMRTRRRRKRRKRRGFVKKEAFIFLILSIPPCSRIRRNTVIPSIHSQKKRKYVECGI